MNQHERIATRDAVMNAGDYTIDQDAAVSQWGSLSERRVDFAEAFPGVKIEEA
jgi:hypothetical protein